MNTRAVDVVSRARAWPGATTFGAVLIVGLVWAISLSPQPFFYDSADYWGNARTFFVHGHFSMLNFTDPVHGYLMSLVCYALAKVGEWLGLSASVTVRIWNVMLFALISTVLLPALARLIWPARSFGILSRLMLAVVFFVLWGGFVLYPLSDFPALAAALVALVALGRADSVRWMILAGLATGCALEMRPAYEGLIGMALVIVIWNWWSERRSTSHPRRVTALIVALASFALVAVPQALISNRHYHLASIVPGAADQLGSYNLTLGMRLQRHDTYVGSNATPTMDYVDRPGRSLLIAEGGTVKSESQLASITAHHPVTMLGVFVSHVVNGLDQRYSTPYVTHIRSDPLLRCLGFLLVFLGLVRFGWPAARRSLGGTRWLYVIALLVLAAPGVITATETRFMLGLVSLLYTAALAPGWPNPLSRSAVGWRRVVVPLSLACALAVFVAAVLPVIHNATQNLVLTVDE